MHVNGPFFRLKELADAMASPLYLLRGRPPWSVGYYTMKKECIKGAIDGSAVRIGKPLPNSFGVAIDEELSSIPGCSIG